MDNLVWWMESKCHDQWEVTRPWCTYNVHAWDKYDNFKFSHHVIYFSKWLQFTKRNWSQDDKISAYQWLQDGSIGSNLKQGFSWKCLCSKVQLKWKWIQVSLIIVTTTFTKYMQVQTTRVQSFEIIIKHISSPACS